MKEFISNTKMRNEVILVEGVEQKELTVILSLEIFAYDSIVNGKFCGGIQKSFKINCEAYATDDG